VTSEELLARFEEGAGSVAQANQPSTETNPEESGVADEGEAVSRPASPSARKLAKESGLSLTSIDGSGRPILKVTTERQRIYAVHATTGGERSGSNAAHQYFRTAKGIALVVAAQATTIR